VIVNISSISADQGYPFTAVYAASKAAVAAFTEGLSIELAPFGVAVKAVFPGQHSTRIFTKIDAAVDVPADYAESMKAFFGANASGSAPDVTANIIFQAVTDGDMTRARYYSGPDGVAIPRLRQLLGGAWYWEEFRAANSGAPSDLWKSLVPRAGDPVEMGV
jgi:NAD(P)-dependent dehydrogenase (short-subunit alcohol dehydrogenase family)